jgi:hypothetical protein
MTPSVQTYAKAAGGLLLLSLLVGSFGEFYVPTKLIVANDAAATASNFVAHETLFRLGFACYLVEALCDLALALVFYVILKPVDKYLSLLAVLFGIVSTTTFAVAELFYFTASRLATSPKYLESFSPEQLHGLTLLAVKVSAWGGGGVFMVFYGVASLLRGYLILRSGYLPKLLGALLALGGIGFITKSFTFVLAPAYSSDFFLLPMFVGGLSLTLWLLFKGIDATKWEAQARTANAAS